MKLYEYLKLGSSSLILPITLVSPKVGSHMPIVKLWGKKLKKKEITKDSKQN
jgi:hypothetical protein